MFNKIKCKNFNGYFYIEPYRPNDEIYYYDQHKQVLNYIDTNFIDESEYNHIVESLQNAVNTTEFISYLNDDVTISKDRYTLIRDVYDSCEDDLYTQALIDELEDDNQWLHDDEFCVKYLVYQIGDTYFYMGDY